MTEIAVKVGDLLDEAADVIVSTANPWLNMSGGVNGAVLSRGGEKVQEELHLYLRNLGKSAVEPGTVVLTSPGPLRARQILHAVAIDPFYDSSIEAIECTLRTVLTESRRLGAKTVAMPALATGYGHLSMEQFAAGFVRAVATGECAPIERVVVVVRKEEDAEIIRHAMAQEAGIRSCQSSCRHKHGENMGSPEVLKNIQRELVGRFESVALKGVGPSSFLFIEHGVRAVEVSENGGKWWIEFWDTGDEDAEAVDEMTVASPEEAVQQISRWLVAG